MANVLILEPDRKQNRFMCDALTRAGHRAVASHSVREAEKRLHNTRMMTVINAQVPFTQSYEFVRTLAERGLPVSRVDVYETPLNCATYYCD